MFDQIRSNCDHQRKRAAPWSGALSAFARRYGWLQVGGWGVWAALSVCSLAAVPRLLAQQPAPPEHPQPQTSTILAAQLSTTITADTEAMVVGHTDFSRYTTPHFCLMAVRHAVRVLGRSIPAQEAADLARRTDPAHDTLPAGVAPIARACAARFTVATVAPAALPDLFELALFGQQDSLAAAIVARRVALTVGPAARAALLLTVLQSYLAVAPARVAAAEALAARLDALGQSGDAAAVLPNRLAAHQALLALGDATRDWPRVRCEATTIVTLLRALPAAQQGEHARNLLDAYRSLLLLAAQQAPDSVMPYARQLQAEAQQVVTAVGHTRQDGVDVHALRPYATLSPDSVLWHLAVVDGHSEKLVGQPTPPLEADFWFPAKDTTPPGRGHVSLYVELPEVCYESYWPDQVLDPITTGCQRIYDQIRWWAAQAGSQQLAITLVVVTVPRLADVVLDGSQTAEEAAKNLDWFIRQYLKLPVQYVAVQMIPITEPLPGPDGRRFAQVPYDRWSDNALGNDTPFQRQYHAGVYKTPTTPALVLTGRDGRYRYGGGPSVVFDRLLTLALGPPAASASPAAAGAGTPPVAVHPLPGTP